MKKFLIIGNKNAITYKEIFPLFKENKLWWGVTMQCGGRFILPTTDETFSSSSYKQLENGKNTVVICGGHWFTNISNQQRNTPLDLYKKYTPEEYPKYDNYDAIEVSKTCDIPMDYDGVMGVPITFLDKYCPDQFEILGCTGANIIPQGWEGMSKEFISLYYKQGNTGILKEGNMLAGFIDSKGQAKVPYSRILIKRK